MHARRDVLQDNHTLVRQSYNLEPKQIKMTYLQHLGWVEADGDYWQVLVVCGCLVLGWCLGVEQALKYHKNGRCGWVSDHKNRSCGQKGCGEPTWRLAANKYTSHAWVMNSSEGFSVMPCPTICSSSAGDNIQSTLDTLTTSGCR